MNSPQLPDAIFAAAQHTVTDSYDKLVFLCNVHYRRQMPLRSTC